MKTSAQKNTSKKEDPAENFPNQRRSGKIQSPQFEDHRPEHNKQLSYQELADNSNRSTTFNPINIASGITAQAKQFTTQSLSSQKSQTDHIQDKISPQYNAYNSELPDSSSNPIQRIKAYDSQEIDVVNDPRHFSKAGIKEAIDLCVAQGASLPGWLKEQVAGYLRDELSNRHDDMQRYQGGDDGHQHYFRLVQEYVDKIEARPEADESSNLVPERGPVAQLRLTSESEHAANDGYSLPEKKTNQTGLPDNLKAGIETLSGQNMDDVKVHFNSNKPAQLQAYAYAQGSEIYLGSGQEKHLPHEAWHVVQQKQGRVKPTIQLKGKIPVNDDPSLEQEADTMGAKSLELNQSHQESNQTKDNNTAIQDQTIQRIRQYTRLADGNLGPPIVQIDIDTLDETQVMPYLANIELYGENGIPPGSNIQFEPGDRAALLNRRDHQDFGNASAITIQQIIDNPAAILNPNNQNALTVTTAGRQLAADFPHFIGTYQAVRGSASVLGFGQWAASKIVTVRGLLNPLANEEAANQLLDYMSELREVERRIPDLAPGETIHIGEQPIPGVAAQTADLTMSQGKQVEVKTVREPIVFSKPVLNQLSEAIQKFHNASPAHGPYEAVIYATYSLPQLRKTGKGKAHGNTTNSCNFDNGDFMESFVPDQPGGRPASINQLGSLAPEILNWLLTSGVNGTNTANFVRIRIVNSNHTAFNFRRDPANGWEQF